MKRARMRKRFSAIVLNSIATLALQLAIISNASVSNLRIFMNEMESMALSVAREVENIYADRCNRLSSCVSFHECKSTFDEATKECRTDYVADCKDVENSGCGKTYDFFRTNVRIPSQLLNTQTSQPEGAHLKEDICYSNSMTETFKNTAENLEKTSDRILQPPQTFFGTSNGMFRIWPAQHSEVCGVMDTRIRPWFVAASSGPKDVVILIDKSGSMHELNRWNLAVNAAKSVINTLTIGDHFNVVLFSDTAETLVFPALMRATAENKETVLRALEESSYGGLTNFEAAFDKAYDLFQSSKTTEISSNCHRAVLFLSDGVPTRGKTGTTLYTHIADKNIFDATIFSYALGANADTATSKEIACTSGGIYANIPDGGDLIQQMSSYYKLYAILQGGAENMNFTTWVEPYLYSSGVMGTTVSTPVFYRSSNPPLWIGVVGVDFTISELEEAVGGTDRYQAVLDELVAVSTATCPKTNFEEQACLIEALRRDDSSEGGICGSPGSSSCSFQTVTPLLCSGVNFPSMFWENAFVYNTPDYISRGCCVGGTGVCSSDGSAESESSLILVILLLIGAIGTGVVLLLYYRTKKQGPRNLYYTPGVEGVTNGTNSNLTRSVVSLPLQLSSNSSADYYGRYISPQGTSAQYVVTAAADRIVGNDECLGSHNVANDSSHLLSPEFTRVVAKLKFANAKGFEIPSEFISSITLEVISDPVITADGQTYDREAISAWFKNNPGKITSPLTGKEINSTNLIPNYTLRARMCEWLEENESRISRL